MQEGTEVRTRKRRKKKSRFGYYLYAVVVLLLTLANITLAILLLTHVQTMHVSGTNISSEEEISAWITEDPLTVNSIYTFFKYKFGTYQLPVYLEDVKVSLKLPWEVQVDVEEKSIIGCAFYRKNYVYFDKEGLVLKIEAEKDENVPLIEGMGIRGAEVFKLLNLREEKTVSYANDLIKALKKTSLEPTRIVWAEDSMNLYFEGVCVELGKSNYGVKLAELPPILEELTGKTGVLRMKYYSETGDSISFEETK